MPQDLSYLSESKISEKGEYKFVKWWQLDIREKINSCVKLHGQFWVQFQDNFVDNFRDNVKDNFGDNKKKLGSIFVNNIATKGTFQSSCQSSNC